MITHYILIDVDVWQIMIVSPLGICRKPCIRNCAQLLGLGNFTLIDTLQSNRRLYTQVRRDQVWDWVADADAKAEEKVFAFSMAFHPFFVAYPQAASCAANTILWTATGRGRMSDCAHWEANAKLFNWLFQLQFNFVVRNVGTANWSFLERTRKRPKPGTDRKCEGWGG